MGDVGTGLPIMVGSLAFIIGGALLPFLVTRPAPMPASIRKILRTGVEWREPHPAAIAGGIVIEVIGWLGLFYGMTQMRR